jgi:putative flippase GtrA/precorrin-6B methylase 2
MKNDEAHTFAIPAYKESLYLEECVLSLLKQEKKSKIIITTSTPNDFIKGIAEKYEIELIVNPKYESIADDWNFALRQSKTPYVTLAHQDDIYLPGFTKQVCEAFQKSEKAIITFTDYSELINGRVEKTTLALAVKRLLLFLFILKQEWFLRAAKRSALVFGNAIGCPSVSFNKNLLGNFSFKADYDVCLDWALWLELANFKETSFVYIPEKLIVHRLSPENATAKSIHDKHRQREDMEVFKQIWPLVIARFIHFFFQLCYCREEYDSVGNPRHILYFEIIRFILGGLSTMFLCFSLALSLVYIFHVNYLVSNNIATLASWVYSYWINKLFVFKNKEKKHLIQGTGFFIAQTFFLITANIILYVEVEVLRVPYVIAIFILSAIMAFLNFICMKMLIFRRAKKNTPDIKAPKGYTERSLKLSTKWWKRLLPVQLPYRLIIKKNVRGSMLEIGCGTGRVLKHFSTNGIGIDNNEFSIKECQKQNLRAFTVKDFVGSEFDQEAAYDNLLFIHVLEHMSSGQAVELIKKYKKNLRRNGKLVIACPQEKGFASDPTHVEFMDIQKLSEICKQAGFEIVKTFSFPFPRNCGKFFLYNESYLVGRIKNN